ncbi:hypothetical protein VTK73DRAFT_3722 [Phialemonium thermophilum]|uniref:Uncharacterized protein n=1 Tax=Phialemonium thermophilum TaxID=223376 RepID=A0ABR3VFI9_9PEZI
MDQGRRWLVSRNSTSQRRNRTHHILSKHHVSHSKMSRNVSVGGDAVTLCASIEHRHVRSPSNAVVVVGTSTAGEKGDEKEIDCTCGCPAFPFYCTSSQRHATPIVHIMYGKELFLYNPVTVHASLSQAECVSLGVRWAETQATYLASRPLTQGREDRSKGKEEKKK